MKIDDRRIDIHKTINELNPGDVFFHNSKTYIMTTEHDKMTYGVICVSLFDGKIEDFRKSDIVIPVDAKVVIE